MPAWFGFVVPTPGCSIDAPGGYLLGGQIGTPEVLNWSMDGAVSLRPESVRSPGGAGLWLRSGGTCSRVWRGAEVAAVVEVGLGFEAVTQGRVAGVPPRPGRGQGIGGQEA